jgi:hypothetical protein
MPEYTTLYLERVFIIKIFRTSYLTLDFIVSATIYLSETSRNRKKQINNLIENSILLMVTIGIYVMSQYVSSTRLQ